MAREPGAEGGGDRGKGCEAIQQGPAWPAFPPELAQSPSFLRVTTPLGWLCHTATSSQASGVSLHSCNRVAGSCSPFLRRQNSLGRAGKVGAKLRFISISQRVLIINLKPGWGIGPILGKVFAHLLERETHRMMEPGCSKRGGIGVRKAMGRNNCSSLDLQRPA